MSKESDKYVREPLVTIGIPTYQRNEGAIKTIALLLSQTYKNTEIIVSDNDPNSTLRRKISDNFLLNKNINYYKQSNNIGALNNFEFLLKKSNGKYFMWAADDDMWDATFISTLVKILEKDFKISAAMCEAQYYSGSKTFKFFPEGLDFYENNKTRVSEKRERLRHTLVSNYGNLFYSIYRRSSLFISGKTIFNYYRIRSLNEIPILLAVSEFGRIRVISKILFRKQANEVIYSQAKWEKLGGILPGKDNRNYNLLLAEVKYHFRTLFDIYNVLVRMRLSIVDKVELLVLSVIYLINHQVNLIRGFK